jgi:hypothetical protein
MPFCPICGAHHDPNMLCIDRAGEALKDMGVKQPQKELKKAHRWAADSLMIRIAFFVLLGFAILIVGANLLHKYRWP